MRARGRHEHLQQRVIVERLREHLGYDEMWNIKAWVDDASRVSHEVELFGRPVSMITTNDVDLGNGEMRITGGDVVLFVDGNLTLGTGGGPGLNNDPGSSLTVIVTGRTRIGSSVQMARRAPVNADGTPAFAIYSTSDQHGGDSSRLPAEPGSTTTRRSELAAEVRRA